MREGGSEGQRGQQAEGRAAEEAAQGPQGEEGGGEGLQLQQGSPGGALQLLQCLAYGSQLLRLAAVVPQLSAGLLQRLTEGVVLPGMRHEHATVR